MARSNQTSAKGWGLPTILILIAVAYAALVWLPPLTGSSGWVVIALAYLLMLVVAYKGLEKVTALLRGDEKLKNLPEMGLYLLIVLAVLGFLAWAGILSTGRYLLFQSRMGTRDEKLIESICKEGIPADYEVSEKADALILAGQSQDVPVKLRLQETPFLATDPADLRFVACMRGDKVLIGQYEYVRRKIHCEKSGYRYDVLIDFYDLSSGKKETMTVLGTEPPDSIQACEDQLGYPDKQRVIDRLGNMVLARRGDPDAATRLFQEKAGFEAAKVTEETESPTEVAVAPDWPILIDESFNNNVNDWPIGSHKDETITLYRTIIDGAYSWETSSDQGVHLQTMFRSEPLSDFSVNVKMKRESFSGQGRHGIDFGTSEDNYFSFLIEEPDSFHILMYNEGSWQSLSGEMETDALQPGKYNQIRVIVEGSHISFWINDSPAGDIKEAAIEPRYVGISIDLMAGAEGTVLYDNFQARAP